MLVQHIQSIGISSTNKRHPMINSFNFIQVINLQPWLYYKGHNCIGDKSTAALMKQAMGAKVLARIPDTQYTSTGACSVYIMMTCSIDDYL